MPTLKTAVIMAGGKGTRLANITGVLPKPMVKIKNIEETGRVFDADNTILAHQMDLLSQEGITDFILVVGNKKGFIKNAFTNDKINALLPNRGISIRYFEEQEENPLGTGGSFCSKELQQMIGQDDFLLTYADVLFDVNIQDMFRFHKQQGADATMVVMPSKDPDDRVLCRLGEDGSTITQLIPKQGKGEAPRGCAFPNIARNGITIFNTSLFNTLPKECTYMDMETHILTPMVYNPNYKVCAWASPCYVKDIGTEDRYWEGVDDLKQGIPEAKNPAKNPQACVIFREQDLIQSGGGLNRPTADAIAELNEKGVIVGLQCIEKKLPLETTIAEMAIDTALIRQGGGAYVNFKFGEEDVAPLFKAMAEWNISPERTYVIENAVEHGYLISNFSKGDQSFQLSPLSASYEILLKIENEKQQDLQVQSAPAIQDIYSSIIQSRVQDALTDLPLGDQQLASDLQIEGTDMITDTTPQDALDTTAGQVADIMQQIKQDIMPQTVLPNGEGQ